MIAAPFKGCARAGARWSAEGLVQANQVKSPAKHLENKWRAITAGRREGITVNDLPSSEIDPVFKQAYRSASEKRKSFRE